MLIRFLHNYALRHQHPANQILHVIGLPVTFVLPVVLVLEGFSEWWAILSFVVGYILQFAGHAIEGNDAGEIVLIKKMLGRPYIDIVRRNCPSNQSLNDGPAVDSSDDG